MFFFFLLSFPFTLIYIGVIALSLVYLYMGIVQLAGNKTTIGRDIKGGVISIVVSILVLMLASYAYFEWIWPWATIFW